MKPVICYGRADKHWIMLREQTANRLASVLDPTWGTVPTWGDLRAAIGPSPSFTVQVVTGGARFAPVNEVALEIPAVAKTIAKHGLFVLGQVMDHELPSEITDIGTPVFSPIYGQAATFRFIAGYQATRAISAAGFDPRQDDELIARCLGRERRYSPRSRFASAPEEFQPRPAPPHGYVYPPVPEVIAALAKVAPALHATPSLANLPARMRFQAAILLEEIYGHAIDIWYRHGGGSLPPALPRRRRREGEEEFDRRLCERLYQVHCAYRLMRQAADGVTYWPESEDVGEGDRIEIMRHVRAIAISTAELYQEIDQAESFR